MEETRERTFALQRLQNKKEEKERLISEKIDILNAGISEEDLLNLNLTFDQDEPLANNDMIKQNYKLEIKLPRLFAIILTLNNEQFRAYRSGFANANEDIIDTDIGNLSMKDDIPLINGREEYLEGYYNLVIQSPEYSRLIIIHEDVLRQCSGTARNLMEYFFHEDVKKNMIFPVDSRLEVDVLDDIFHLLHFRGKKIDVSPSNFGRQLKEGKDDKFFISYFYGLRKIIILLHLCSRYEITFFDVAAKYDEEVSDQLYDLIKRFIKYYPIDSDHLNQLSPDWIKKIELSNLIKFLNESNRVLRRTLKSTMEYIAVGIEPTIKLHIDLEIWNHFNDLLYKLFMDKIKSIIPQQDIQVEAVVFPENFDFVRDEIEVNQVGYDRLLVII